MLVSTAGLVFIQIYWIKSAMQQKEEQFSLNVNEALVQFEADLEKARLQEYWGDALNWEDFENEFFANIDSFGVRFDTTRGEVYNEIYYDLYDDGTSRNIKILERTKTFNSEILVFEDYGKPRSINETKSFMPSVSDNKINKSLELGNTKVRLLAKNQNFIKNIFREIISDYLIDKNDSLNLLMVDSLLNKAIRSHGITTDFEYAVFTQRDGLTLFKGTDTAKVTASDYQKAFLFDGFSKVGVVSIYFPHKVSYLFRNIWPLLLSSIILLIIIIFSFSYTIFTIYRQKKFSEIKNDLINNITHELKTPISTISLACQSMSDPDLMAISSMKDNYLKIIMDENKRLGNLVENVLQTAIYEKGDFKLRLKFVNMHQKIEQVINSLKIQANTKNISIIKEFGAHTFLIEADETHITNVLFNLMDNAIKYNKSKEPWVKISTENKMDKLLISVEDNGIGISKENHKRVFDKLYRVPSGNVHDVKGYGLGLAYVKSTVEKHGGEIVLKSEIGKGSRFTIILPLKQN